MMRSKIKSFQTREPLNLCVLGSYANEESVDFDLSFLVLARITSKPEVNCCDQMLSLKIPGRPLEHLSDMDISQQLAQLDSKIR